MFHKFTGAGTERWGEEVSNRSNYNREYADRDWDVDNSSNSANKYRDRTLDDEYDVDKEESDSESRNNQNNVRKFRDNEESPPASSAAAKRVNLNLNQAITNSPKKSAKPLKKVDLGAAANYGRDSSQSPIPGATKASEGDLLNDDFDPRAVETVVDNGKVSEFGDFEAAFSADNTPSAKKSDDDFADFSSAFDGGTSAQDKLNLFTAPTNLVAPPTQPTQSSSDLLGDFTNLNINTASTLSFPSNNNQSFNGSSLLDGLNGGK